MVPTVLLSMLRTLLLRMLPRVITTLLLTMLPRRCQSCCEAGANRAANQINLLLGWRDWLVGAASEPLRLRCGWLPSLACLLGALAAAPGSVAMLAHRRIAFRPALARWRFRFQAVIEFFGFLCTHHSHVGNVRSA